MLLLSKAIEQRNQRLVGSDVRLIESGDYPSYIVALILILARDETDQKESKSLPERTGWTGG